MHRRALGFCGALALVAALSGPAANAAAGQPHPAETAGSDHAHRDGPIDRGADDGDDEVSGWTVAADHLNNPRQVTVAKGAVYVAEAGTGGKDCSGPTPAVGPTGSVTRVQGGKAERVQTGLVSLCLTENGNVEIVGVDAVALQGRALYGIATGSCPPLPVPGVPPGLPPAVESQLGHLLRLNGIAPVDTVADVSALECAKDPDGQGPDSDPYGIAVKGDTFYVADAAGNDIVMVRDGVASVLTVLATKDHPQPVPTSLAFGPDGALYVGTLAFRDGPGGANVYRIDVATGTAAVYAAGLTAITGIAFDRHGNLYASEFTTALGPTGPGPDGAVVMIPPGGGMAGRKIIGAGTLHFTGGVGVSGDDLYVSNWSVLPGQDGAVPGNHGQLLRLELGH